MATHRQMETLKYMGNLRGKVILVPDANGNKETTDEAEFDTLPRFEKDKIRERFQRYRSRVIVLRPVME